MSKPSFQPTSNAVWKKALDEKTGRVYYYHSKTHEIVYRCPLELATPEQAIEILKERAERQAFFRILESNVKRKVEQGRRTRHVDSKQSDYDFKSNVPSNEFTFHSSTLDKYTRSRNFSFSLTGVDGFEVDDRWDTDSDAALIAPPKAVRREREAKGIVEDRRHATGTPIPRPIRTISTLDLGCSLEMTSHPSYTDLRSLADRVRSSPRKRTGSRDISDHTGRAISRDDDVVANKTGKGGLGTGMGSGMGSIGGACCGGIGGRGTPTPTQPPPLRRINSTGTIYINTTMSQQDNKTTIECVCLVLRAHMVESKRLGMYATGPEKIGVLEVFTDAAYSGKGLAQGLHKIPPLETISDFFHMVYSKSQLAPECIIIALIYMERLIKDTNGELHIRFDNFKSIIFSCLVMASKVWDDLSMWNVDFSQVAPSFSLSRINTLEIAVLRALKFSIKVPPTEYAKYYFLLRDILSTLGLQDGGRVVPLDMIGARQLQLTHTPSVHLPSGLGRGIGVKGSPVGGIVSTGMHSSRTIFPKHHSAINLSSFVDSDTSLVTDIGNNRCPGNALPLLKNRVSLDTLLSGDHTDADGTVFVGKGQKK